MTAANSSSISDGAAALVLMREADARAPRPADPRPHARPRQPRPGAGALPDRPGAGGAEAARPARLDASRDVDLWEVNEAFAVVPMAFMAETGAAARAAERARRRLRARPPDRRLGRAHPRHAAPRARAARPRDRPRRDLHRRRRGHGRRHGAASDAPRPRHARRRHAAAPPASAPPPPARSRGAAPASAVLDLDAGRGAQVAGEVHGLYCAGRRHRPGLGRRRARRAAAAHGAARLAVACAGIAPAARTVDRDGRPHDPALFAQVVAVNLVGTFHLATPGRGGDGGARRRSRRRRARRDRHHRLGRRLRGPDRPDRLRRLEGRRWRR